MRQKSAIIPYRHLKDGLQFLLIRNATDSQWIIPKGNISPKTNAVLSAAKEALEEAGVFGKTVPILVGEYWVNQQHVPTYLIEVKTLLPNYKEVESRARLWVDEEHIDQFISNPSLLELLYKGKKILTRKGAYFKHALQSFCVENDIEILKLKKNRAVLLFPASASSFTKIYMQRNGDQLHLYLPRNKFFKELSNLSEKKTFQYLRQNTNNLPGHWYIEEHSKGYFFNLRYEAKLSDVLSGQFYYLLDQLVIQFRDKRKK